MKKTGPKDGHQRNTAGKWITIGLKVTDKNSVQSFEKVRRMVNSIKGGRNINLGSRVSRIETLPESVNSRN